MKIQLTTSELERIAAKFGWRQHRLGGACLAHALRAGADPEAICASWRKNQPGMFHPHRRGVK